MTQLVNHQFSQATSAEIHAAVTALRSELGGEVDQHRLVSEAWRYRQKLSTDALEPLHLLSQGKSPALRLTFSANTFPTFLGTPTRYHEKEPNYSWTDLQLAILLLGGVLGTPAGYRYARNGSIVANVIPLREHATRSNVTGNYLTSLAFHTEDAFHPYCADYLALGCQRNSERTPTWIAPVAMANIDDSMWEVLSRPIFQLKSNEAGYDTTAFPLQPILSGTRTAPFLRVPVHRKFAPDAKSEEAFNRLLGELDRVRFPVALSEGEILFFDNLRVAHAREAYDAQLDGKGGRWLSRFLFVTDIRRGAGYRESNESIVFA